MKKRSAVILMVLVFAVALISGCGTGSNSDIGKSVAESYYSSMADNDYQACLSLFHPSLVDNVGGKDVLLDALAQITEVYGDVTDYKVKQTGFYTSGGESDIDLEITVNYSTGVETTDTMTVYVQKDGSASITAISTGQAE